MRKFCSPFLPILLAMVICLVLATGLFDLGEMIRPVDRKNIAHMQRHCISSPYYVSPALVEKVGEALAGRSLRLVAFEHVTRNRQRAALPESLTSMYLAACNQKFETNSRTIDAGWQFLSAAVYDGRLTSVETLLAGGERRIFTACVNEMLTNHDMVISDYPGNKLTLSVCERSMTPLMALLQSDFAESDHFKQQDEGNAWAQSLAKQVATLGIKVATPKAFHYAKLNVAVRNDGQVEAIYTATRNGDRVREIDEIIAQIPRLRLRAVNPSSASQGIWISIILDFQGERLNVFADDKVRVYGRRLSEGR